MMPSYNRIPKDKLVLSEKMVSVNDEMVLSEDVFEKTVVQKQIEDVKKRILDHEEETMRSIEENRDRIFSEAKEKGYAEGLRTAIEEAKIELKIELQDEFNRANDLLHQCNERLERTIAETESVRDHYMEKRKEELVDLALSMAKHIAISAASVDKKVVMEAYEASMSQIRYSSKDIFIRVHPDTEKLVLQFFGNDLPSRIHYLTDLSLSPLDFVLETDREFIDATLESKLKLVEEGVRRVLHDQHGRTT